MRVSNFHRTAERVIYPSFSGGLNLSVPPESLGKEELQEALNVEYSPSSGAMTVRGGLVWSGRFDAVLDGVLPVTGKRGFLVRHKGTRKVSYFRWNTIWPVEGKLSGDGELSVVQWEDEHLVSSGGKLQRFTDEGMPRLETLEGSPSDSRQVFVRGGRVGVLSGDDTLKFSAVGDAESWENDPSDASTGQSVEIGYKDGMKIDAVVPLSRDLMVFKSRDLMVFKSPSGEASRGTIYRLTGDYPNWAVLEAAHNTGTYSPQSVLVIGNEVIYVTPSGIASLRSVMEYGDIKATWPDRKVSKELTPKLSEAAELWDVPAKEQVWVKPRTGTRELWILDYPRGIWTRYEFPKEVLKVLCYETGTYVFIGRDLYKLEDGYTQDGMKETGKVEIEARLKLGTILSGNQVLIKKAFASFGIYPKCEAELRLGKFRMKFTGGGKVDYIYDAPNDTQYASEDDDPLYPDAGTQTARRQCIVRDWSITPEVSIKGGGCWLSMIGLEKVEV